MYSFQYTYGTMPILLIHGWASSSRMWRRLALGLGDQASCYAVDLAGFGSTPPTNPLPTIERYVDDVLRWLDDQPNPPRTLIAHSMGGMVAMQIALKAPERFDALVLICPVVSGRFLFGASQWLKFNWGQQLLQASQPIWSAVRQTPLRTIATLPWYVDPEMAEQIRVDFQRMHLPSAFHAMIDMAHTDLSPHLGELKTRTLLASASLDPTVPPAESDRANRLLPQVTRVHYQTRHHPHDEARTAFIHDLRQFLWGE